MTIYAYRKWGKDPNKSTLASVNGGPSPTKLHHYQWVSKVMPEAECTARWARVTMDRYYAAHTKDFQVPAKGCSCGYYSTKTLAPLLEDTGTYAHGFSYAVFGVVRIWGKVIPHSIGYRSQFAEIVAFIKEDFNDYRLLSADLGYNAYDNLQDTYDVPIISHAYAKAEFGLE